MFFPDLAWACMSLFLLIHLKNNKLISLPFLTNCVKMQTVLKNTVSDMFFLKKCCSVITGQYSKVCFGVN